MSKEKQIDKLCNDLNKIFDEEYRERRIITAYHTAKGLYEKGYRKQSEWISVEERLPTKDEYLTHHNDGLDTLKRITVAYMTDTIEYTIGCYDGYKWVNQLGNKKINDVIAWKPFELYEAPKGGAE